MSDVTFMGLGLMGTALTKSAMEAGWDVAVWNRSEFRGEPLIAKGARLYSEPAKAIAQSPIVVVCVRDYAAANGFLQSPAARETLCGRVLVQLTSGSPRMARSSHQWFTEAGATYLDGAIMVAPSRIGQADSLLLLSGDEEGFVIAESLLRVLAPRIDYLGADPARASALDSAILSGALGVFLGVINAAAICESTGLPLEKYSEYVPLMFDDLDAARDSLGKIAENRLEETEAPLEVWAATTEYMIQAAEDGGYSAEISLFIRDLCGRAMRRGLGHQSIGALIEVLRPDSA